MAGPSGVPGPAGPAGADGAAGPSGPPGPSASTTAQALGPIELDSTSKQVMLASLTVAFPARLLATADVQVDGDGGGNDRVSCSLAGPGGVMGLAIAHEIPETASDVSAFGVTGGQDVAPGTHEVRVRCTETSGTAAFEAGNLTVWATGR